MSAATVQVEELADPPYWEDLHVGPRSRIFSSYQCVPYLPGLDGMRALAVIAVMVFHANHDWLPAGFLGVEVFFVISGYLITLLLIAEHERDGEVSLAAFWGRRFRRLLPAMYLTLIGVVVYCALFKREELGHLRGDVVAAVFYVSNWFQIWSGQGYGASESFVPLRHLWSLAVEEQFYLIWPLVMIWLLRRGRERLPQVGMWLIAIAFVIAGVTSALFHSGFVTGAESTPDAFTGVLGRQVDTNNFLYLSTITRSSGILLGAGFAMLWRPVAMMRGPMRDKGRTLDIVAIVALLGLAGQMLVYELVGGGTYYPPLFNGGLLLTGILTVMLIAAVTHSDSIIAKLLGNPVLNWVGTRSYGLYLFHWPIYQMIRKQAGLALTFPKFVLALVLTGIVTEASYRLLETPVRKREFFARFRERTPQVMLGLAAFGLLVGYGGVSLANSEVQCTTSSCRNTQAAQQALEDLNSTTSAAESTETAATQSTVPGQSTVPETTTTVARRVIPLIAIGESVMAGAASQLTEQGVIVDAAESRSANKVLELVTAYAQNNDVEVMVIQVGTNSPVSQSEFDKIAAAAAPVQRVFFMTIKAPLGYVGANNTIITALPATYPNVQIINWQAEGATIESELSKSDGGIHLNSGTAVRFYSNLILGAAGKTLISDPDATATS